MASSLCLRGRRRLRAVLAAVGATVVAGAPTPASADVVTFVGACTLDLHVGFTPSVDRLPSPTAISFTGTGECLVNGSSVAATFSGAAATTPLVGWSCLAGVATGTGTFDTNYPDMSPQPVTLVLAAEGPALTVAAVNAPVFTGAGEFLQTATATNDCLADRARTTIDYTGAFAFEDPIIT